MTEKKRVTFTIAVVATPNENVCENVVKNNNKKRKQPEITDFFAKNTSFKNDLMS